MLYKSKLSENAQQMQECIKNADGIPRVQRAKQAPSARLKTKELAAEILKELDPPQRRHVALPLPLRAAPLAADAAPEAAGRGERGGVGGSSGGGEEAAGEAGVAEGERGGGCNSGEDGESCEGGASGGSGSSGGGSSAPGSEANDAGGWARIGREFWLRGAWWKGASAAESRSLYLFRVAEYRAAHRLSFKTPSASYRGAQDSHDGGGARGAGEGGGPAVEHRQAVAHA